MGRDIIAVSKAKRVACDYSDERCNDSHVPVGGSWGRRRGGLKCGCYIPGKGGRNASFAINNYNYGMWRAELSHMALGVRPEAVWDDPRGYKGKPFVELIDFPDGDMFTIGARIAAKLYADFVAFAARAKRHYSNPPPRNQPQNVQRPGKQKRYSQSLGFAGVVEAADALGMEIQKAEGVEWMWWVYCDFRRVFKLASDGGFVTFC